MVFLLRKRERDVNACVVLWGFIREIVQTFRSAHCVQGT